MACALKLRRFLQTEDGAVTVDWVVLTAAVMMIGAVSGFIVSSAVPELANTLSSYMSNASVGVN